MFMNRSQWPVRSRQCPGLSIVDSIQQTSRRRQWASQIWWILVAIFPHRYEQMMHAETMEEENYCGTGDFPGIGETPSWKITIAAEVTTVLCCRSGRAIVALV